MDIHTDTKIDINNINIDIGDIDIIEHGYRHSYRYRYRYRYRHRCKHRYHLLVLPLWGTLTKIMQQAVYIWKGWEDLKNIKQKQLNFLRTEQDSSPRNTK